VRFLFSLSLAVAFCLPAALADAAAQDTRPADYREPVSYAQPESLVTSRSLEALPAPVAETRRAILAAAKARDVAALSGLVTYRYFAFEESAEAAPQAAPLSAWSALAERADLFAALSELLAGPYYEADGVYIWQAPLRPATLGAAVKGPERDGLAASLPGTTRHSLGINEDGVWLFLRAE